MGNANRPFWRDMQKYPRSGTCSIKLTFSSKLLSLYKHSDDPKNIIAE